MKRIKFLVTRIFVFLPSVPKRIKGRVFYDKLFFGLGDIFCCLFTKKTPKKLKVWVFEYTDKSELLDIIKDGDKKICGLHDICWLLRNSSPLSLLGEEYKDGRLLVSNVLMESKSSNQVLLGIYFNSEGVWKTSFHTIFDNSNSNSTITKNTKVEFVVIT